jgi:hypothetical protein
MGKKQNAYRVWLGNMKEGVHLENLGVCGRIILKWSVTAVQWEGKDFMHLAHERDNLWALVNMAVNCLVALNAGNIITSCRTLMLSRKSLHHGVGWSVGMK